MFRTPVMPLLILMLTFLSTAHAEKANLSPVQLREISTHVVTGKVNAVYQRTESEGSWEITRYVAEIRVTACEKGEGIGAGQLVYVRYWTRRWVAMDPMPPSTTGHRGLPGAGAAVRVYLSRNAYDGFGDGNKDGGFNVIGANGFEMLEEPDPEE